MGTQEMLFSLLRYVICGDDASLRICPEMLPQIYALANAHDQAHLVGQALSELGLLTDDEISQKFQKKTIHAVYRYARQNYELQRIGSVLEAAGIHFIPLKGAVLRQYYPQSWMRTCCDVDILVQPDKLHQAQELLVQKLGYTQTTMSSHDICLKAPSGVLLELHYDTIEEALMAGSSRVMERVWQQAVSAKGKRFWLELPDDMLYFYHVSHMAKHIKNGGCGIRPLLDLWIMDHRMVYDRQKREKLLQEGGLLPFAHAVQQLSEGWFSGVGSGDRVLERYILAGGSYGSVANRVASKQIEKGGKLRYALHRVFQPYDSIKYYYPVLQKHKWLLPVFWVVRWGRLLFKGHIKKSVRELKINTRMLEAERTAVEQMLSRLGLD